MTKFSLVSLCLVTSLFLFQYNLYAQDTLRNKKDGEYLFTVQSDIEATDVVSQDRTGTCWSFSTLSFLESELIRLGKGSHKLSEMFVVRMAYMEKAERYVRMHGTINFGQGGASHDIPMVVRKYGMVPQEVYKGLEYGTETHNHSEMEAMLKAMLDAVIAQKQGQLTTSWKKAVSAVLDAYLGVVPESFTYQGKTYTPRSFADQMGLKMEDYRFISSFTHHPFNAYFVLEIPDNWSAGSVYNLPLDAFLNVATTALDKGYGITWTADVSEKGFSFRDGLAILPEDEAALTQTGASKTVHDAGEGPDKQGTQFDRPGPERQVTQLSRQQDFDNYLTTDDHLMHITGWVKDQHGDPYFIVKNSWGKRNECDGYLYASLPYVAAKTIAFMVHKDALDKELLKQMDAAR